MCDKYNKKILDYKDENLFIIFYSLSCGFCVNAINTLKENKLSFKGYDIDKIKGGLGKLLYCLNQNKNETNFNESHTTKPIIFYKGKFIGGFTDLQSFLK